MSTTLTTRRISRLVPADAGHSRPTLEAHLQRYGALPPGGRLRLGGERAPAGRGRALRPDRPGRRRLFHGPKVVAGPFHPPPDAHCQRHGGRAGQRQGPFPGGVRPSSRARRRRPGRHGGWARPGPSSVWPTAPWEWPGAWPGRSGNAAAVAARRPGPRSAGSRAATSPEKSPPWPLRWAEARPPPVPAGQVASRCAPAATPPLIHNAETLANVALIARYGADWFREVGAPEAPGTCLVTVSGGVGHPGVVEVATGTPISEIIELARLTAPAQAVLVGGYGGRLVVGRGPRDGVRTGRTAASGRFDGRRGARGPAHRFVRDQGDGADRPLHGRAERRAMRPLPVRLAGDRRRPRRHRRRYSRPGGPRPAPGALPVR